MTYVLATKQAKYNKTAYQPQVFATEFLNNKRPYTFLKALFFLKAYQTQMPNPNQTIRSLCNNGGNSNF